MSVNSTVSIAPDSPESRQRALELLADRATDGLGHDESAELDGLLLEHPELDDDAVDVAAAALCLAGVAGEAWTMPPAVHERVERSSRRWLEVHGRSGRHTPRIAASALESVVGAGDARPAGRVGGDRRRGRWSGAIGWLAAAAALTLAALAWWPSIALRRTPAEARTELLSASTDLVTWPWTRVEHALCSPRLSGDVVWDGGRQEGFLRIGGLASNDPTARQYQLWIFDATRDDRYPIDGGVFNIPPDCGEVVIPIHADLDVREPTMFAVSVEPPGGVVVSKRELVAYAKP